MKKKVVVGLSGGVDSSVAACLLKEQGYDVIGVTMQIWQEEDSCTVEENGGCCGLSAVEDARRVAWTLGIPYYVMNFRKEFQKNVIDYFVAEYLHGRTPNPCIACNRYVKWEALLERSLEICFVPDNDYAGFIEREASDVPGCGNFVDKNGVILGKHKGITHYTVGQRKGLNLAMGHPVFVTGIRPETNEVVIGDGNDVFSDHLICRDVNWMAIDGLHGEEKEVLAKIRYSHKGSPCIIRELPDGTVECQFKEPQRAITPGQAVVFYEDECVVGGGTIL